MAAKVKDDYLTSKFSFDTDLKSIAEKLLENKNKKFALELNKAVKKLGPQSKIRILKRLSEKYPQISTQTYRIESYSNVLGETQKVVLAPFLDFEDDNHSNLEQSIWGGDLNKDSTGDDVNEEDNLSTNPSSQTLSFNNFLKAIFIFLFLGLLITMCSTL